MIQNISRSQFSDAFRDCSRGDSFSYAGFTALYDYLTQLENDCGMQIELDVIALDSEYCEDELELVLKYYDLESIDELRHNTTVIELDDETIIYVAY